MLKILCNNIGLVFMTLDKKSELKNFRRSIHWASFKLRTVGVAIEAQRVKPPLVTHAFPIGALLLTQLPAGASCKAAETAPRARAAATNRAESQAPGLSVAWHCHFVGIREVT